MALFARVGRGARFSNEGPGDTDVRRSDIRGAAAQTPLADARTTVAGKATPCCLSFECFRTSTSRLLASVGDNRVFAWFFLSLFLSFSLCSALLPISLALPRARGHLLCHSVDASANMSNYTPGFPDCPPNSATQLPKSSFCEYFSGNGRFFDGVL